MIKDIFRKSRTKGETYKAFILSALFLFYFLISLTFISSANFGVNGIYITDDLENGSNYTINVNNTDYFQGYTPLTLRDYFETYYDTQYYGLDNPYGYLNSSIVYNITDGNTTGQMIYWNGSTWLPIESTDLFWDGTNKRLSINNPTPTVGFEVWGQSIFSYGAASGAINIGADVNTITRSSNTRKLAAMVMPSYANPGNKIEFFSGDAISAVTTNLNFGGREGGSSYAATDIYFVTALNPTTTGGTRKLHIDRNGNIEILDGDLDVNGNIRQDDNQKKYYGDADDVSIEYNGTHWNFLQEVGSGIFNFDTNGGLINLLSNVFISGDLNATTIYQNESQVITNKYTGWVEYIDNDYNTTNRLTVNTTLLNFTMNNYTINGQEKPIDVDQWFNGSHINPTTAGDSYAVKLRFNAEPQGLTEYCEFYVNIDGSVGQIPLRLVTFPKGIGNEHIVSFTNVEYALDTWKQNGGKIQVECSDNVELWDIELTIQRLHQGRGTYP